MATVQEVLLKSGWTQEQINALDAKAMAGFNGVLTTAEQQRLEATQAATKAEADRQAAVAAQAQAEKDRQAAKAAQDAAELQKRSVDEFWQNTYNPAVAGWETERNELATKAANAAAESAFWKAQNEGARSAGFVPAEAPKFDVTTVTPPARNAQGQYVSGAPGSTPGSPTFLNPNEIAGRIGDVAGAISDIQWKHQSLYGRPLPVAPSELIRQADALKLSPMDYAARTFNFGAREQELAKQATEAHEKAIRDEVGAEKQKEFEAKEKALRDEFTAKERLRAEQVGNNPDVRVPPGSSKFAEVARAVKEGTLPDPLKMTDAQRRMATRQTIHAEIAQREEAVA